MRTQALLATLPRRLKDPLSWIAIAVFGVLYSMMEIASYHSRGYGGRWVWVAGAVAPTVASMGYGLLSALPWQWTGDDRAHAGTLRGSLQALAAGTLFFWGIHQLDRVLFLWLLHPAHHGPWIRLALFPFLIQAPVFALMGLFIAIAERGEVARHVAEERLKEAQWILLRNQLGPHVLFNTLNALAELARQDPEATERALLDLSELYESILRHADGLLAPLGRERFILERYLAMQRLRLGSRLSVVWDWDEALDAQEAPPLLLQPLVENAIKHGIAASPGEGVLQIQGHRDAAGLHFAVRNTGVPPRQSNPGTGLYNLEERLTLAYAGKARFRLDREGDWTVAALFLPESPWNR